MSACYDGRPCATAAEWAARFLNERASKRRMVEVVGAELERDAALTEDAEQLLREYNAPEVQAHALEGQVE